jgi:hypothetical protein
MTAAIPDGVPSELISGDSWAWTLELTDYPSSGSWVTTIFFEKADSSFSVVGTASGTTHSFAVAAATTASYRDGLYGWRARVASGSVVTTVLSGMSQIQFNPGASGNRDTRSWARRTLEAIEAFLEGNASTAQASMSVAGRQISRWSLTELATWRDKLRGEVRAEMVSAGTGKGRDIKVRFN